MKIAVRKFKGVYNTELANLVDDAYGLYNRVTLSKEVFLYIFVHFVTGVKLVTFLLLCSRNK